jgi:hypothetical protein
MRKSTKLGNVRETAWRIVATGLGVALVATACAGRQGEAETVADEITVTFDGNRCVYNGPDGVPEGRFTVILDVEDQQKHDGYGVAVVTLDEGQTFEDPDAWPSTKPPKWVQIHGLLDRVPQGTRAETTVTAFEGPLFLVCFTGSPVTKSGTLGPVKVVKSMGVDFMKASWPSSYARARSGLTLYPVG